MKSVRHLEQDLKTIGGYLDVLRQQLELAETDERRVELSSAITAFQIDVDAKGELLKRLREVDEANRCTCEQCLDSGKPCGFDCDAKSDRECLGCRDRRHMGRDGDL